LKKKKALKNTTAGIVASLEGMKIRVIVKRYCIYRFSKITYSWREDVLPHEETKLQVENTEVG
jgi:hypothetical protein